MKKLLQGLCLFLSINSISFANLEYSQNAYIKCYSHTGVLLFEGNVKEYTSQWVNPGSSNDTNRIVSADKVANGRSISMICAYLYVEELPTK